jgi:hypothetical protein
MTDANSYTGFLDVEVFYLCPTTLIRIASPGKLVLDVDIHLQN